MQNEYHIYFIEDAKRVCSIAKMYMYELQTDKKERSYPKDFMQATS